MQRRITPVAVAASEPSIRALPQLFDSAQLDDREQGERLFNGLLARARWPDSALVVVRAYEAAVLESAALEGGHLRLAELREVAELGEEEVQRLLEGKDHALCSALSELGLPEALLDAERAEAIQAINRAFRKRVRGLFFLFLNRPGASRRLVC